MNEVIKNLLLQKYGNGTYFLVVASVKDRVRLEVWNAERTKILFLFEGEL